MRKVILSMKTGEKRGAVTEDGNIAQWLFEQENELTRSGNIILGKVEDIVPGMEAAFVNIGAERNGFLYRNELIGYLPYRENEDQGKAPSVSSLLTKGQTIVVQVTKEETGNKGVRLTEDISLPGKYIVYMPHANYVAVSKKMKSGEVREKWRSFGKTALKDQEGMIIRTVAESAEEGAVLEELGRLRDQHEEMMQKTKEAAPPYLLFDQSSLIYRVHRDLFTDGKTEVITDDYQAYQSLLKWSGDDARERLQLYQGKEDLFDAFGLGQQLDKSLKKHVWLKNGGFLIVESTEAMTVIDVNTGKYTGKGSLRETVLKTNTDAAYAVAEQLRLRDIGGIVIIDFIDMKQEEDKAVVLKALKKGTSADPGLTNIAGFTHFGLVEMTRKKVRKPLEELLTEPCEVCSGTGRLRTVKSGAAELERGILELKNTEDEAVLVEVSPRLLKEMLGNGNVSRLHKLEGSSGKKLFLLSSTELQGKFPYYIIRMLGSREKIKNVWLERK